MYSIILGGIVPIPSERTLGQNLAEWSTYRYKPMMKKMKKLVAL
jgi:hypothetical protein